MRTSGSEKQVGLAGKLDQVTKGWAILKALPALFSLLHSVPVLAFSPTGATNIARRFHITVDELECCIVAVLGENLRQSRPDWAALDLAQVTKPTHELLEVIRKAVSPKRRRKAAAKPKPASKAKKVGEGRTNA